jgi:hypothetical protein
MLIHSFDMTRGEVQKMIAKYDDNPSQAASEATTNATVPNEATTTTMSHQSNRDVIICTHTRQPSTCKITKLHFKGGIEK